LPLLCSLCPLGLGYPDQALQRSNEALTLARELAHPLSLSFALYFAAVVHQFRQEGPLAQERAEAAITLATEQGFLPFLAWGPILRGWALAEQEQAEEGITQIHQGLAAYRTAESGLWQRWFLALLAEAYGKAGQAEEGISVLAKALALADNRGERFSEAELYRLKGELTLQKFQVSSSKFQVPNTQHPIPSTQAETEAEACFLKAIEVARCQSAKSWELRATASLARLWQRQGKKKQAHKMLMEIYGWFTEGFDTADLQEAKTLLETLSS
jgi:predicted ATPase